MPQGCGKTTLVKSLERLLLQGPGGYRSIVLSIDDFYLTRREQEVSSSSSSSSGGGGSTETREGM